MSTNPLLVTATAQFFGTSQASWSGLQNPVPAGTVAVATDVGDVKLGNGIDFYDDLPILFNLQDMAELWQFLHADTRFLRELRVGTDAIQVNADGPGTLSFSVGDQTMVLAKSGGVFSLRHKDANGVPFKIDGSSGGLEFTADSGSGIAFIVNPGGTVTINGDRVLTTDDLSNITFVPSAIALGTSQISLDNSTTGPAVVLSKDGVAVSASGAWATLGTGVGEVVANTPATRHTAAVVSSTGDLHIQATDSTHHIAAVAGSVAIKGGNAANGSSLDGGVVAVVGGNGDVSNNGGSVSVTGGRSTGDGAGGTAVIQGGLGGSSGGLGGIAAVRGGHGVYGNAAGGRAEVVGGNAVGAAQGGDVWIMAGTSTGGDSGNIVIVAEAATSVGKLDGKIEMTAAGGAFVNDSPVVTELELGTYEEFVAAMTASSA